MKLSLALSTIAASSLASIAHGMDQCGVFYDETTGHYYKAMDEDGLGSWTDARDLADDMTFCGVQGHLVTITTQAEQDFIHSVVGGCGNGGGLAASWIGAYQPTDVEQGPFAGWMWVSGEPWSYTNWCEGEANDFGGPGSEEFGQMLIGSGCWNDNYETSSYYSINTFVVEFDDVPSDCGDLPGVGMNGDPHVKTWGGTWFDYMGQCDMVLVHAPDFDGQGLDLDIHVRTTIRYDYSYIEAAAIKIGDDVLEVGSFGDFALNGVDMNSLEDEEEANLSGYNLVHTQVNKKRHSYDIVLGPHENVTLSTFKDLVAVTINSGVQSKKYFGNSVGVMGSYNGALLARDGVTAMDDMDAFGQEWQVTAEEEMLFRSARYPQAPLKCILPDATKSASAQRRLGETVAHKAAEDACAYLNGQSYENCVKDVMATGDLELAAAGAF